jgi:hypothetical protein
LKKQTEYPVGGCASSGNDIILVGQRKMMFAPPHTKMGSGGADHCVIMAIIDPTIGTLLGHIDGIKFPYIERIFLRVLKSYTSFDLKHYVSYNLLNQYFYNKGI